jgi:hypothetical protein
MNQRGLCGRVGHCDRLCARSIYCPLGQARARQLLAAQRQRRTLRRLIIRQALEAKVIRAAGSFAAFQRQLAWERKRQGGC